jgi:hypothetical protein
MSNLKTISPPQKEYRKKTSSSNILKITHLLIRDTSCLTHCCTSQSSWRMQDNTREINNEIIRIVSKYIIKRAFKLYDEESRLRSLQRIVSDLRLTSKHLNIGLCDELSLEIMHRWMKGA